MTDPKEALKTLVASVRSVLAELKPGQSLHPAGASKTNILVSDVNAAERALASLSASVGVTDEMVEAACAAKYGTGELREWLRGIGVPPNTFLRIALEAALSLPSSGGEVVAE